MHRLLVVNLVSVALLIALLWLGLGRWGTQGGSAREYLLKRDLVAPLQGLKGARPFTPQEMDLLRRFARDPDRFIRCRALYALAYAREPQQWREAVQIATERLKDEEWVVRVYALRTLARLGAKEAVSSLLPLLNDPQPEVRQQARKTLQQLGYKVGE